MGSSVHEDFRRPRRRWPLVLGAVVLVIALGAGGGYFWLRHQIDASGHRGAAVMLTIPKGASTTEIAALLERKGVVADATVFRYYARVKGTAPIEAGNYTLYRHDPLADVVAILGRGPQRPENDRITIPEGLTLPEIADRVGRLPGRSAERFLSIARSGSVRSPLQPAGSTNLEGLLAPDTYYVEKGDDEARILSRMVDGFVQKADAAGLTEAAARLNISPYQAVVVASLVEREAKVDVDRAMISRVIYNRLAKGMLLQIDATVEFALGGHRSRVLNKDLEVVSPYNTYKVKGLPPGPIANPGLKSLEAAANPTPGSWLYYVLAGPDGHHAFATTAQEFAKLRAAAQAKGLL